MRLAHVINDQVTNNDVTIDYVRLTAPRNISIGDSIDIEFLKDYGYILLEYVEAEEPETNLYIEGFNDIIRDGKVFQEWIVREKTYQEKLDDCHRNRVAEYPPYGEFLDAIVKKESGDSSLISEGESQYDAYIQKCLEVKTKYPLPEE